MDEEGNMKKLMMVTAALLFSGSVYAERYSVTGEVTNISIHMKAWAGVNTNQDGYLFVKMDEMSGICTHGRAVIPTTHPLFDHVYDLALNAKLNDVAITLNVDDSNRYVSNACDLLIAAVN